MNNQYTLQYWGKARPASIQGASWHPLERHCLDVAAVAWVYLKQDLRLRHTMAALLGVQDDEALIPTLVFFIALHDLGKFSDSFQGLCPELALKLQGLTNFRDYTEHHDVTGHLFWLEAVLPAWAERAWLSVSVGGTPPRSRKLEHLLSPWIRAVTGHHGTPPRALNAPLSEYFRRNARTHALEFVDALAELLRPPPLMLPDGTHSQLLTHSAWLLSGLTVMADWLGSNQSFFPYNTTPMTLAEYWTSAKSQARRALQDSGLLAPTPAAQKPIRALFPFIKQPSPLQRLAAEMPLGVGPQLVIIEEVTGGGKTEAALYLTHRLMATGRADGVYFALPTMATANAMDVRLGSPSKGEAAFYRRLYPEGAEPGFVLAHSARDLKPLQPLEQPGQDQAYGPQKTAGQQATAWLLDNRKKALLAQVGVGTIDQALLGILPSRHAPLRLLGLHRKVLIVDEVHAYDPYMNELLLELLRFQAALGGSVILLSATLPAQTRQELVEAFRGVSGEAEAVMDYPLVTRADEVSQETHAPPSRPGLARAVGIQLLSEKTLVLDKLLAVVEGGGCACWIRNTVADAVEGWELVREHLSEDRLILFHARFMLGDRLEIEAEVLRRFGKTSTTAQRAGFLVIATQVVEQSLDIDFDFMVSDLAPIDLLLQRAGRLHRHARGTRGEPVLGVLAPRWTETPDEGWLSRFLPGTAAVYPNHGQLWLTQRELVHRGELRTPGDSRALIEAVYGPDAQALIPEGLLSRSFQAEGEALTQAGVAEINCVRLREGYAHKSAWLSDTITPTRLGDPQKTWELARMDGDVVVPLCEARQERLWKQWRMSQISVRQYQLDQRAPDERSENAEAERETPPWIKLLIMESEGDLMVASGIDERGRPVCVQYSQKTGLFIELEGR